MFRYENFYYFWIKGFDIRRETQSFYTVFFIWLLSRAALMARKLVSAQRDPKVEPPRSASSFNSVNFLQNPPNPPCASSAWRHPHISAYCDISEWYVRPARASVNTCMNRNSSAMMLQVGKMIPWELCKNFKFDYTKKRYMHIPKSVQEKET